MPRVGLYLRISEDRDGEQTATSRQRADCERFAEAKGWEVADVFEDVDLSAYKRHVKRPEFDRMIEAVRANEIDGVVSWHIDRLSRHLSPFTRLMEACEDQGAFVATVTDGVDTRTEAGQFHATVLVGHARMSSADASRRIVRKHEELAAKGMPTLGGSRMFGYNITRTAVIPEEAVLIREAAQRVYGGESLRGICWDWSKRGILSTMGKTWRQTSLRRLLLSPTLSGQRSHRGVLSAGTWPAILTPDDTRRLQLILKDPNRLTRVTARRYLLTGMLRCGVCGETLWPRPRGDKVPRYVCARQPGRANCGMVARLAGPVEEVVREAVFIALDGADIRDYVAHSDGRETDELLEAIRADEEALADWAREAAANHISPSELYAARDVINGRLQGNRDRLAKANGHGLLNNVVGAGEMVRKQWDERGLDWQRAVIAAVVDHVVLQPAVRGRNTFDPSLVRVVWRF